MKKMFLAALAVACSLCLGTAQNITGDWYGKLDVNMSKLTMVFHISHSGDGYVTVMDSPDQGAKGLPTSSTTFSDGKLVVTASALGMKYEGRLVGDRLEGTFSQGGFSAPLEFSRDAITRNRPQTPQPPYPYRAEEVVFENEAAGIALAGTLTLPQGDGPFPAAVLISGSGAQNRDEELMGHKPFLVLADYLTRRGIAVLRYDDRGVGGSGGDYASASIQDFATDAESALEYLFSRDDIDGSRVGLIGHSEGGLLVYMIAGSRDDVAFIVSMAGPTVLGYDALSEQRRLLNEAFGGTEETYRQNEMLVKRINDMVDADSPEYVMENLDSLTLDMMPSYLRGDAQAVAQCREAIKGALSPEIISLQRYDPTVDIGRIGCPILAIVGEKDLQVPASVSVVPLEGKVREGTPLTTVIYPDLNHLFQHAGTGLPTEYVEIEETVSPQVMEDMAEWIRGLWK